MEHEVFSSCWLFVAVYTACAKELILSEPRRGCQEGDAGGVDGPLELAIPAFAGDIALKIFPSASSGRSP